LAGEGCAPSLQKICPFVLVQAPQGTIEHLAAPFAVTQLYPHAAVPLVVTQRICSGTPYRNTEPGGSAQKIFPLVVTHLPNGVVAHAAFPLVVLQS